MDSHSLCVDAGTGHGFQMDQQRGSKLTGTAKLKQEVFQGLRIGYLNTQLRGTNQSFLAAAIYLAKKKTKL